MTSPLHAIDVVRPEPTRATVTLQRRDEIPNRDFVLRYAVAGDAGAERLARPPRRDRRRLREPGPAAAEARDRDDRRAEGADLRDRPLGLAERRTAGQGQGDDALDPRSHEPERHLPDRRLRQHGESAVSHPAARDTGDAYPGARLHRRARGQRRDDDGRGGPRGVRDAGRRPSAARRHVHDRRLHRQRLRGDRPGAAAPCDLALVSVRDRQRRRTASSSTAWPARAAARSTTCC